MNKMDYKNNKYAAIDLMKFISAILVVMIHTKPLIDISEFWNNGLVNGLCRIAVPFFFMVSGFFLFRKNDIDLFERLKKYSGKILKIYIVLYIVYLPITIVRSIEAGCTNIFKELIIYIRNFFVSAPHHLWYLPSLIVAIWLVYFYVRKGKYKTMMFVSLLLFSIGLFGQSYFGLLIQIIGKGKIYIILKCISKLIVGTRNGFFFGFLFVAMGAFFANRNIKLNKIHVRIYFLISVVMLILESYCVMSLEWIRGEDMYIFLVPTVFFLFLMLLNINIEYRKVYYIFRMLSMNIFYNHIWIIFIYDSFICKVIRNHFWGHSLVRFISVLILSVIVAYISFYFKENVHRLKAGIEGV